MNDTADDRRASGAPPTMDAILRASREHGASHVASSLSHALGTPLQVISGRAAMIQADPEDAARHAELVVKQVKETTDLLGRVLDYLRPDEDPLECDLVDVCRVVVGIERAAAEAKGVELEAPLEGGHPARTRVRALEQVLLGLVASVVASSSKGGRIGLDVRREICEPPESDRAFARPGPAGIFTLSCRGVSAPREDHVREPWLAETFGERSVELPRALAHQVARKHGGWIESAAGNDELVVRLCWPIEGGGD